MVCKYIPVCIFKIIFQNFISEFRLCIVCAADNLSGKFVKKKSRTDVWDVLLAGIKVGSGRYAKVFVVINSLTIEPQQFVLK